MFLVVGLHALLLLLLWQMAPPAMRILEPRKGAIEVRLLPNDPIPSPNPQPRDKPTPEPAAGAQKPPAPVPPKAPAPANPPAVPEGYSFKLMEGMEKFDLAQLPKGAPSAGTHLATGDSGAPAALEGGSIPGKERLFPAQWQRKPTRAELSAYFPKGLRAATGFGMIACRTIANYRVDDCEELEQSPAGSGLAGAVRQAAWQFRVMPPRVGGRTLVGAWVRIRIDYTQGVPE
ncbi:hypothetical protein [Sphingosinicella sp. BN140058]|uniref:hypothetical protein n=1 Tax=Sphingosinicella sp. BN140058 TaxID=1892855 RepID=UPI0010118CCE|nr:hypothetical protein [Sphingosinicella sp. BN140058]QAY79029.1 hypothetical protein ETR14_22685 [Sphingosinicella sp. BN140058]